MTPAELVEPVARAIAATQDDDWNNPSLFMVDANDTAESCREAYRDMARAAIAIALEEAAKVADQHQYAANAVFSDVVTRAEDGARSLELAGATAVGMSHEAWRIAAAIRALINEEPNGR